MAVHAKDPEDKIGRKRKPHKKSRGGCGNCKIRRVKCDETRPKCEKCTTFGVTCNYDGKAPDLQMCFDSKVCIKSPQPSNQPIIDWVDSSIWHYPTVGHEIDDTSFTFDADTLARVARFQTRTILTIGTGRTAKIYQNQTVKLAFTQPYLMHVIQTLTSIHDRHLTTPLSPRHTTTELYHWTLAVRLFNAHLSRPITQNHDKDALWATAALLGAIAFTSITSSTPETSWPLSPPSPDDLEWLRMSEGKWAIWEIANPLRSDSVFNHLIDEQDLVRLTAPPPQGIEGIPEKFCTLFKLDESSSKDNNPYFAAVHMLVPWLSILCEQSNIMWWLGFTNRMAFAFRDLLIQKDPRAMLLLAYWYAKVWGTVWWVARRSILEGRAICIWLERECGADKEIMELLQFPKLSLGLVTGELLLDNTIWRENGVENMKGEGRSCRVESPVVCCMGQKSVEI